jgi:hypothetical protein
MIDDHSSGLPGAPAEESLFGEVTTLIEQARGRVALTVNAELTMLYWGIGRRIREDVLDGARGQYGQQVVRRLAERLTARHGRGFSRANLASMMRFAELYPSASIVQTLSGQLTWSHFVQVIALADADERRFYAALAAREHWSVRTLSQQIQRRLYQRALDGRDPAALAADLADVTGGDTAPTLALRDPYVLDFVGLDSAHSEADLERGDVWRPRPGSLGRGSVRAAGWRCRSRGGRSAGRGLAVACGRERVAASLVQV